MLRVRGRKKTMPKKPTGPMANKPMPDPTSSYPGTPQIMKQGKMVKNSYEPEDDMVEGYKKIDKKKENKMSKKEPHVLDIKKDKNYAWCQCNESEGQPFCDGSHTKTRSSTNRLQIRHFKRSSSLWL